MKKGTNKMTITLELTPEQEQRVASAEAQGIDVPKLMLNTLNYFPPVSSKPAEAKKERVLRGCGKYAYLSPMVDAYEREKQEELDREERKFQERTG